MIHFLYKIYYFIVNFLFLYPQILAKATLEKLNILYFFFFFLKNILYFLTLYFCFVFQQVTLNSDKSKAVEFKISWSSSPDCLKYKSYFGLPEFIEFPTEVPGQTAYAYFYPPTNPVYEAYQKEKPPLLLKSHGMYGSHVYCFSVGCAQYLCCLVVYLYSYRIF